MKHFQKLLETGTGQARAKLKLLLAVKRANKYETACIVPLILEELKLFTLQDQVRRECNVFEVDWLIIDQYWNVDPEMVFVRSDFVDYACTR